MRKMDIDFNAMMGIEDMSMMRQSSVSRLMSEEQINQAKDRFLEDANRALEDALRLHANIGNDGVPIWFWALFVFFAYDDVLRMLLSPILFYPTMLVVSVAGLLYSMGLGPLFVPVVKSQVNMYARMAGLGDVL